MKKHIKTIALVLAIALAAASLFANYSLSKEIENLRSAINHNQNNIHNQINGIYQNVDEKLEKQASLLEKSDYEYGKVDVSAGTVELNVSVLPKEYSSATIAKIVCAGKDYPLEFANGSYNGTVTLSLYEEYAECLDIILTDGDTIRTETPEWYFSPVSLLGQLYVNDGDISSGGTYEKDAYKADIRGTLEMQYHCKKDIGSLKELRLVQEINGEEKMSIPIPLDATVPDGFDVRTEPIDPDGEYTTEIYYYKINQTFEAPYDSIQAVYIEALDTNGLRYRTAIAQGSVTCKITRSHIYSGDFVYANQIIGPDGKVLWQQI